MDVGWVDWPGIYDYEGPFLGLGPVTFSFLLFKVLFCGLPAFPRSLLKFFLWPPFFYCCVYEFLVPPTDYGLVTELLPFLLVDSIFGSGKRALS